MSKQEYLKSKRSEVSQVMMQTGRLNDETADRIRPHELENVAPTFCYTVSGKEKKQCKQRRVLLLDGVFLVLGANLSDTKPIFSERVTKIQPSLLPTATITPIRSQSLECFPLKLKISDHAKLTLFFCSLCERQTILSSILKTQGIQRLHDQYVDFRLVGDSAGLARNHLTGKTAAIKMIYLDELKSGHYAKSQDSGDVLAT